MAINDYNVFQEYVTPEEVNSLPLTYFEGEIVVVTEKDKVNAAVNEIRKNKVVGFDTETRPTFVKGHFNYISLIQIAIPAKVFLFRINLTGFTDALVDLMSDSKIRKAGVGLRDDLAGLQKIRDFEPGGFVEVHDFVKNLGVRNTGLRKLAAILMEVRISKGQQTSNWENSVLTRSQLRYAATDAWICLSMYNMLEKKGFVY